MKKSDILREVKIGKGLKKLGFKRDFYLYQESDRVVLVDYDTLKETKAAKEMHDWIRKELKK